MNPGLEILSHRGYWKEPAEKNTPAAFRRSFDLGFGTETDLRDCLGKLVISHDPAPAGALDADEFFKAYVAAPGRTLSGESGREDARGTPESPRGLTTARPHLALNIKADGLQPLLRAALDRFAITKYFVFDMAIPDALIYARNGFRVFTRQSEFETVPALYDQACGVWLDAFVSDWFDQDTVARHLDAGKQVCIVSPELHRRDHRPLWERIARMSAPGSSLMLCTDLPQEARDFFHAAH